MKYDNIPSIDELVKHETTHEEFEDILNMLLAWEQQARIQMCLDEFNSKIWKSFNNIGKG